VDGATVHFNQDYKGQVQDGVLLVMVYLTARPYTNYTVAKEGYYPVTQPITTYPAKDQVLDLYVVLEPIPTVNYTINAMAGPNGKIVPNGTITVPAGSSLDFTVTPDIGYNVKSLSLDGEDLGRCRVTASPASRQTTPSMPSSRRPCSGSLPSPPRTGP